jgi:hypothetical protein
VSRFEVAGWMAEVDALYDRAVDADAELYDAVGTDREDECAVAAAAAKRAYRDAARAVAGRGYTVACSRCGGAGGSDSWRFTGWTCYGCGGSGDEHRTYSVRRFQKSAQKRHAEDVARAAEMAARDEAYEAALVELGAVGEALRVAKAAHDKLAAADAYGEDEVVYDRENQFRADLAVKLWKFGSLSEAQVAAVERGLERDAAEAAKQARAKAAGKLGGKMDVEGTVLATKWQDSQYGSTKKMLVELDDGRRLWGTVSASLETATVDESGLVSTALLGKGDRVAFTATVEASQDDETFGFFKRPTKARVLARAEQEEEA